MAEKMTNEVDAKATQDALSRLRLYLTPHAGNTIPEEKSDEYEKNCTTDTTAERRDSSVTHLPPKSGEVATVRPLPRTCKEHLRVTYLLQASLPGNRVHDNVTIWDMRNPSLVSQFEQHTSGFLELDAWISVNELGPENCMQDVYKSGFTSPTRKKKSHNQRGMKFATGNIHLANPAKTGKRQYVLCKIAVGRSFVVDSEEEAYVTELSPEYNSFYLNASKAQGSKGYYHEYIVNNNLQVLPQYLVQFGCTPFSPDTIPTCEMCDSRASAVSCTACDSALCNNCDKVVHAANKIVMKHKRIPIHEANFAITTNCAQHRSELVKYYCPTCNVPVCVNCKMVGDHSCGEFSNHRVVVIKDAYTASIEESSRPDALIQSRQNVIKDRVKLIRDRITEIENNSKTIEQQIRQCMEIALAQVAKERKQKVKTLSGEELELKRQLEHIDWAEGFLCQQRNMLDPVDFLNAWNHHKLLRTELREFPVMHTPNAENVKADIQLVGRIQVLSGMNENNSEYLLCSGSMVSHDNNNNVSGNNLMKKLFQDSGDGEPQESPSKNSQIGSNPLSPKSTLLIAKVKSNLAKGMNARTMTGKKKSNQVRRPSASGIDNLQSLMGTLRTDKLKSPTKVSCTDEWSQKMRSEMHGMS